MRQDHLFPFIWLKRFFCAIIVLLAVSMNAPASAAPGGNGVARIGALSNGSAGDAPLPWTSVAPSCEHFGEISFVGVMGQHMYWFIGAGALMLIVLLAALYVTALNRALTAEIVERRRVEAALRASVERFEHIASSSADWIWETDAAHCFTYSSSIVEQMLGYRADEIIGKNHFDLFAAAEKERLMTLGQKGVGTGARIFRERFRLLTKDGRVVIQETTAEPIIDSDGQFAGYRGVNRDITNQVRFVRLRQ